MRKYFFSLIMFLMTVAAFAQPAPNNIDSSYGNAGTLEIGVQSFGSNFAALGSDLYLKKIIANKAGETIIVSTLSGDRFKDRFNDQIGVVIVSKEGRIKAAKKIPINIMGSDYNSFALILDAMNVIFDYPEIAAAADDQNNIYKTPLIHMIKKSQYRGAKPRGNFFGKSCLVCLLYQARTYFQNKVS